MPKISVIVPIYNTERYLDECLRSILAQSMRDFEVICVDDRSPDLCHRIVEKYIQEDQRVRLIRHKHNLGLGGARNTGIRAAASPYIASVDSDDYIAPNTLERLWDEVDYQTVDVVAFGYEAVNDKARVLFRYTPEPQKIWNANNAINIFELTRPSFWQKLWRASLFTANDIEFPDHIYYDDAATIPRALAFARTIRVIPDALYKYRIRSGSQSYSYSEKHIIDYFKCFDILDDFLRSHKLCERYQSELFSYMGDNLAFHAENVVASEMEDADKAQYLRHLLMLKLSFIGQHASLRQQGLEELLQMLRCSQSWSNRDAAS